MAQRSSGIGRLVLVMARWWPAIRTLHLSGHGSLSRSAHPYRHWEGDLGSFPCFNGYRDPLLVIIGACRGPLELGLKRCNYSRGICCCNPLSCAKWNFTMVITNRRRRQQEDNRDKTLQQLQSLRNHLGLRILRILSPSF